MEEIDAQNKQDSEIDKPASNEAMRIQLQCIARSLVTSVITSAVTTVLVKNNIITDEQVKVKCRLVGLDR